MTFILNISDRLWKKGITQLLNSKVKSFQNRLEIFIVMVFGILDGFLNYISNFDTFILRLDCPLKFKNTLHSILVCNAVNNCSLVLK